MTIAAASAAIVAAIVAADAANETASVVKFDALVTFAATVALRIRKEHIDKRLNLETDSKGRIVAVVDTSKEQRADLVSALTKGGIGEKDAANIGSMGRSLALFVVPLMVQDGSIRDAMSGERMRQIIEETVMRLTNGKDTYNALEKLRSNKWEQLTQEAAPVADPVVVLDTEVSAALRCLTAALERGDVERIAAHGGASVALALSNAMNAYQAALSQERSEEAAAALEAKAAKVRKSA
jgi:hypothetical protein